MDSVTIDSNKGGEKITDVFFARRPTGEEPVALDDTFGLALSLKKATSSQEEKDAWDNAAFAQKGSELLQ